MSAKPPLKLLLVDDHELLRRGVSALLAGHSEWLIVAEASDGETAVRLAEEMKPDVIVMDVRMRDINGFEATRQIHRSQPSVEVLIFTMHESEYVVRETIASGARGFLLKSEAGQQLVAAVQALGRHEPFFSSRIAARVYREAGLMKRKVRIRRPSAPRG